MNYVSTPIPGVYATPSMLHLVNQFLSCPAAKTLISSKAIFKPIFIQETKQNIAKTLYHVNTDHWKPLKMVISIPERNGVEDLIFEIFNTKIDFINSQSRRVKEAKAGNLSMDQFARGIEIDEFNHAHEHAALSSQCKMLDLPPSFVNDHLKDQPIESALFMEDIECHTDVYRADWIDQYQNIYCIKHPDDARSCTTKKSDLCDRNQLLVLPQDKMEQVLKDRICKKFPQAHEDGKRMYRPFVEENCPPQKTDRSDL